MYEFNSRIRYSEVGVDGKLRLTSLLNYIQDCSTFQSEDMGVGLDYLLSLRQAWVVNYWQVDILRLPKLGEEVIIGTLPYELKGFMGLRNFYMKSKSSGEYLAKVNSVWTLIDIDKIRPVRCNEDMIKAYVLGEKIDMEYLPRKLVFDGEAESFPEIVVTKEHLDTNLHVNNEQYVKMAFELLPENYEVKRLRAEYKKSAFLGDVICPKVYRSEEGIGVALNDENGNTFVNVMFS